MEPNMTADPRNGCLELMNKLLAALTIFERNVKIAHWNYIDIDFVSVHPWLDTIHDDACECIDAVAEEIRKGGFFPQASLQACLNNCPNIHPEESAGPYNKVMVFTMLTMDITEIRKLVDALSTMADENKFWTIQDLANSILSKMNHHMYFVKNTTMAMNIPKED